MSRLFLMSMVVSSVLIVPKAMYGAIVSLTNSGFETVDVDGNVPGDGSNNLGKFNTSDGAEFTTTLYVRSSPGNSGRRVRAYAEFDLSSILGTVSSASLTFRGYSLNEDTNLGLDLYRLTEDFDTAATPYDPSRDSKIDDAIANVANVGASGTGADHTIDVTTIVQSWINSGDDNHGFFFELETDDEENQGLGIALSSVVGSQLVNGGEITLTVDSFVITPEPTAILLALMGLVGMCFTRRRRCRR